MRYEKMIHILITISSQVFQNCRSKTKINEMCILLKKFLVLYEIKLDIV